MCTFVFVLLFGVIKIDFIMIDYCLKTPTGKLVNSTCSAP